MEATSEADLDHLSIHDCLDDSGDSDLDVRGESAIAARAASTISYLDPNGDHLLSPETLLLQIEADVARRDPNFSRENSITQLSEQPPASSRSVRQATPEPSTFPYSLRDALRPSRQPIPTRSQLAGFVPTSPLLTTPPSAPRVRSRDSSRDKSTDDELDRPIQDPATMAILNDMQSRREETDRTSGLLGARLLQGWVDHLFFLFFCVIRGLTK